MYIIFLCILHRCPFEKMESPEDLIVIISTVVIWRHDVQHYNVQHNDTQHDDAQHNGLICDTQHKGHSA
jgi:hypothetical protein